MLNSPRIFLDAVSKYCVTHGIQIEIRAAGWLVLMRGGTKQHLAFGYDLGLNSSVAHRIANDKAATAEVLHALGIPCVPHSVFFSPQMNEVMPPQASWEAMIAVLRENPNGVVIKPNEGTSGNLVFRVSNRPELELAAHRIFASSPSLAISPWLDIEDEIRVVLLDDRPLLVYSKSRPTIVGDGVRSVLELALAGMPYEMRSTVFSDMIYNLDSATLNSIPPPGERQLLSWRHNLDKGAQPVLLGEGKVRDDCVELAAQAANAIGIRFSSIDVVNVNGAWKILEINSGVMMEALGRLHPELVYAAYSAALDKVFD
jgi:glutathione synthase/RimK-type ligase-like ATP-grasp enzyme